jgi:hypothetical protein
MKIPKEIKLMGKTIKIEYKDQIDMDDNYGRALLSKGVILMKKNQESRQEKELTFLHELLHHMCSALSYKDRCFDEDFIDRMSQLLYQVLPQIQDNKKNKPNKNIKPPKYRKVSEGYKP